MNVCDGISGRAGVDVWKRVIHDSHLKDKYRREKWINLPRSTLIQLTAWTAWTISQRVFQCARRGDRRWWWRVDIGVAVDTYLCGPCRRGTFIGRCMVCSCWKISLRGMDIRCFRRVYRRHVTLFSSDVCVSEIEERQPGRGGESVNGEFRSSKLLLLERHWRSRREKKECQYLLSSIVQHGFGETLPSHYKKEEWERMKERERE